MRTLLIASIVLGVVFIGSVLSFNYLSYSSDEMNKSLTSLNAAVEGKKWDSTKGIISEVDIKWKNINNIWTMLLDHQEIDNIEIEMAKMEKYVATKNIEDSLAEIATLRLLFEHIPKKEAVNFRNIF